MKKIISLPLLLALLSLASCNNSDRDTTRPTVEIISPDNDAQFASGTSFNLIIEFADNEMLGSYKIDIHNNSDGHSHTHSHATKSDEHDDHDGDHEHIHFSYKKIAELPASKNARVELVIEIPEYIGNKHIEDGEYHLVVFIADKWGNENMAFRAIHLE